jgi:hypothetical protein
VLACTGQAGARPPESIAARAEKLVNQAHLDTWDRHPGCMPGATHRPSPRWVDGDADPRLVAQLALLRRPQTPEERERSQHPPALWPLVPAELFAGATRIAVAHDGTRLLVRIGATDQHAFDMEPSYERCMAWRRARLRRELRGKPHKLRRSALRLDTEWARLARPRPMPPTTVTVVPDRIAWHGPDDALLRVIRPETWFAGFER